MNFQERPDLIPDVQTPNNEAAQESIHATPTQPVTPSGGRHAIHCLTIIGQVEGHYVLPEQNKTTKYEAVMPQIVAVEEAESIEGLLILLNTVGGDVEAGLALAEMIAGMSKPTVSLVLGGSHSIGVPLAVSSDRSFIVSSASMTIHPVRTSGMVIAAPQVWFWVFPKHWIIFCECRRGSRILL